MNTLRRSLIYAALALAALAADPPRPSPPLQILRQGAAPLTLAQYRGKVIALALIHTTCSHCQQFTTSLNTLAAEYTAKGVQFLECAFNDDALVTLPEFLQRFHPAFPVGYTSHAAVAAYLQRTIIDPRPLYVPRLILIDRTGVIRAEHSGESGFFTNAETNMRTELDKMLNTGK